MTSLASIAPAFVDMAHRIVWCTVATLDGHHRPRTRVLHPIWDWDGEHLTGWVCTGPTPVKRAGIAETPHISLTYWDPTQDTCTAECEVTWITGDEERTELWQRFVDAPEPVGYDPSIIPGWDSPTGSAFAGWRLDPYRLRVFPGTLLLRGEGELLSWHS